MMRRLLDWLLGKKADESVYGFKPPVFTDERSFFFNAPPTSFLDILRASIMDKAIMDRVVIVAFIVFAVCASIIIWNAQEDMRNSPYAVSEDIRKAAATIGNEVQEKAVIQLALAYEIAAREHTKEEAVVAQRELMRALSCMFSVFDPHDPIMSPAVLSSAVRLSVFNTKFKHDGFSRHLEMIKGVDISLTDSNVCNWQNEPLYKFEVSKK